MSCDRLAREDFEHLGEYAMNRMAGSVRLHEALNARLRSVMGAAGEERMHVLMGQRYARCAPGGMSGSPMWSWMHDGAWQQMSQADWQRVADQWTGAGMMRTGDDGWDAGDVALGTVAALLAAALLGSLLVAGRRRRTGNG